MNGKTWICGVLAAALLATPALAAGFPDTEGHWAEEAVERWSGCGVIRGYDDGRFGPGDSITRAQMAALLDRAVAGYYDAAGAYSESGTGAVTIIAAPGVTLRDMTVGGSLIIAPGAEGSETILSNVTVTGGTWVLSGKENQVLALAGSDLGDVTVSGADARLKLEGGAAAGSVTVTGGGAHIRGLADDQQVTVAEGAENVLVNGHAVQPGSTVAAGEDISTDADDLDVVIQPEDRPSGGGGGGGGGQAQDPDEPQNPDEPQDPDEPIHSGELDGEGNVIVDFDDLLNGS